MQRRHPFPLLLLISILIPACQSLSPTTATWTRTDLYLGLTRRDSSLISDAEFQKFLDTAITPAFPDGLTITPATGQYKDTHNLLHKEPSRIITLLYPQKDAPSVNQKISAITTEYCRNFDQECVLRVDTPTIASFPSASPAK